MAHKYVNWAFEQEIKPAGRKFILVALADAANGDGYAFPGQKSLAQLTGQEERSVRNHVEWLEHHGYLRRAERRRKDGTRTSDAYNLPPIDSTGKICRWTTGKLYQGHRQDLPVDAEGHSDPSQTGETPPEQPANFAGHEPTNRQKEPSLPPLPPQASETASPGEGVEVIDVEATALDLTAYQRRQATKPDNGYASSRLASFFPAAHKALIAFRRVHPRGVPDAQFSQWAQSVAEDVDEHGEAAVVAALQKAVDDFPSLRVPFRYYKTCLTPKAVAAAVKAGDEAAALMAHLQRRKAS